MALAFARILLAYDDSAGSRLALAYACALTRKGAALTVAHAANESNVVASAMTTTAFSVIDPAPLITAVDDEGAAILREAVAACAARGITAEPAFIRDSAGAGLLELARSGHFDLIVLGTHGRRGIARAILGSVAERVLRESEIPVLVLTAHVKSPRPAALFERALVAVDDSDPSRQAVSLATRVAADFSTHLLFCNVIDSRDLLVKAATYGYDPTPFETTLRAAARKMLEGAVAAGASGLPADDLVVAEGEPAQTIEHVATQRNCDLIILGSHGRRGVQRLLLGSVAEGLVRTTSLPAIVVPSQKLGS